MFLFNDPTFLLLIPAMVFALYAQYKVRSTYSRFAKVPSARGLSGQEAARAILDAAGLSGVPLEISQGVLSDHYDPRKRVLRLSPDVYNGRSLAALGVAAHEAGHAIQHKESFAPLAVRNAVYPVAGFGSWLAMPLFILGLFLANPRLMDLGIIFFAGAVLFQVITLPVEFNASKRALAVLADRQFLVGSEIDGARAVLSAAALTYVAAAAMALLQLLRLLMLRDSRD